MNEMTGDNQQSNINQGLWGATGIASSENYKDLYKMMRLMCDNVPDLIWAKDLDRSYTFVNKGLCDVVLLTDDVDEPIGKKSSFFYKRIKNEKPNDDEWFTVGDL